MAVAVVCELVVAGGELLQALGRDGGEIAGELGVLGQHHRAPRHERVDQLLLPHRPVSAPLLLRLLGSAPTLLRCRRCRARRRWWGWGGTGWRRGGKDLPNGGVRGKEKGRKKSNSDSGMGTQVFCEPVLGRK